MCKVIFIISKKKWDKNGTFLVKRDKKRAVKSLSGRNAEKKENLVLNGTYDYSGLRPYRNRLCSCRNSNLRWKIRTGPYYVIFSSITLADANVLHAYRGKLHVTETRVRRNLPFSTNPVNRLLADQRNPTFPYNDEWTRTPFVSNVYTRNMVPLPCHFRCRQSNVVTDRGRC